MMFLLHIFVLLYGLAALIVGKLRTTTLFDLAPSWVLENVERYFPESVFKPWQENTTQFIPQLGRTYVIGGGLVLYALRYLHSRHRS